MKKVIVTVLMIFLAYLLQTTIGEAIAIGGIRPNVIIVLVVCCGYRYGRIPGMLAGLAVGLLIDLAEANYIGMNALFYLTIGYMNGWMNKLYYHDFTMVPLILVTASEFLLNLMQYVTGFLMRNRLDLPFYLVRIIVPDVLYTAVLSVLTYRLITMVYLLAEKKPEAEED